MEQQDQTLVAAAIDAERAGGVTNQRIQEALVRRYQPTVQRLAQSIVYDSFDAGTIAQDTMMKALAHLGDLRAVDAFEPWLNRITVNTARSHLAREKRERTKIDALTAELDTDAIQSDTSTLEAPVAEASSFDRLLGCLNQDERTILALRFVSDFGFSEIARHLEIRLSATKMRYYRAIDKLRASLADEGVMASMDWLDLEPGV